MTVEFPPPPMLPEHPHAHWEGDSAHGWTMCTCHMRKNHPRDVEPPPRIPVRRMANCPRCDRWVRAAESVAAIVVLGQHNTDGQFGPVCEGSGLVGAPVEAE